MAEKPPNSETPDPATGDAAHLFNADFVLGEGVGSSDDSPTIISKVPPTQAFMPAPANELASGSIRGRTLAHFELLDPIGVGGMAAVIRARDKQLDRVVALKILPPEMATDPEHVQRFHQEARAAAKLDHENIARVYYCGEDQKLHFIAFEFVEGQNLRTILERRGRLPVQESVHYILQIATGLAHAAARGVVHRDIKPSNIIITPTGRAKLVDMGLARSLTPQDNRQLTQSGVTLGTFDYIPPEQALEPRDADVRSDIYSLGCTFYHMLTGQPPVPEGTAAKKLHHHQYVAPIDPRQLNPEIPDEVAAILQRMMAKEPKDRYQRAEHLVQHLLMVAQRIGGVNVPEGVMFVDAPLPDPPRKRPILLGAIAAGALALFVGIISLWPGSSTLPALQRNSGPNVAIKNEPTAKDKDQVGTKETPVPEKRLVTSAKELAVALADDRVSRIQVANDIALTESGAIFHGSGKRSVIVEPLHTDKAVTLRLSHARDEEQLPFGAGVLIESGTITFKHIRFEVESTDTPHSLVAGVLARGGQVTFDGCTFAQQVPAFDSGPDGDRVPIASVAAWDGGGESAEGRAFLLFRKCWFVGGQAAVSVKGRARVDQTNCALGPHACMFHLWVQDKDRGDEAELLLNNVSAHVIDGPVFRLDERVSCRLEVQYSVFSCPDLAPSHDRAELIRETGAVRSVRYDGKYNAYHNLAGYWVRGNGKEPDTTLESFKKSVEKSLGSDATSVALTVDPWVKSPLADTNPQLTFQVKDNLPQLRRPDQKSRPLGVETCAWGAVYAGPLLNLEPVRPTDTIVKLGPGEWLVDPSGKVKAEPSERVRKKLESALSEAESGHTIYLRHNGPLPVEPVKLTDKRNIKLKPYAGCKPVLVLGKSADKDAALFHLHKSALELEQLEIVLHGEDNRRSLAVINLGDQSVCQFKQCVFTLDNTGFPGLEIDVVTMLDPRETMMMTSPDNSMRPEIHLSGCLVRGRGDLLGIRASRAFDMDIEKSLICLAGSLVTCKANTSDAMMLDARANIKLTRTTTYLAEPLLLLSCPSKTGKGLAFTQVDSSNCLFVSATGKPLVRLDGPEGEMQMKRLLSWTGPGNAYAGFDKVLDAPGSEGPTYYADDWKRFAEAGSDTRFVGALFQPDAGMDRDFLKLTPKDFRLTASEMNNYGAILDQLPRISEETPGSEPGPN
jgi:serine/threonine protein kinase